MHLEAFAKLPLISRILVAAGWAGFFAFFVLKKQPQGQTEAKRDRVSILGIVLQMVGFTAVWMLQRPLPRAGIPLPRWEITLDVLAPILSIVSAWIGLSAVQTLGRQWSYEARLIEGHQLVTQGPYRWVRHPIYTAMLGKLLATNFAFGHWLGLIIAGTTFMIGSLIRIRSEERLLRSQFGPAYDDYARRVPAMIPLLR
jgi:protein-S-isoprenylcysteine O-methyltransferase Ste14